MGRGGIGAQLLRVIGLRAGRVFTCWGDYRTRAEARAAWRRRHAFEQDELPQPPPEPTREREFPTPPKDPRTC